LAGSIPKLMTGLLNKLNSVAERLKEHYMIHHPLREHREQRKQTSHFK